VRSHAARSNGHGRIEARTIATSTWLNDYLTPWPQLGQVFRLERKRTVKGEATAEVIYGITSLTRDEADAERLLALTRNHWGIENGLHHTRDGTFGEDRCRVRRGGGPRVLASLRNIAIHLLRGRKGPSLAAKTRELNARPDEAVAMIASPSPISA